MRTLTLFGLLALSISGCSKDDAAPPPSAGAESSAAVPASAAEAYAGPLTVDRLEQAKGEVKPFMAWDTAYAKLLARVGTPNLIDGDEHYWYLKQDDKCHELFVENASGEVGAVSFGAYDKIMKRQWERCAGAEVAPGAAPAPGEVAPTGDSAATDGEDDGW